MSARSENTQGSNNIYSYVNAKDHAASNFYYDGQEAIVPMPFHISLYSVTSSRPLRAQNMLVFSTLIDLYVIFALLF